MTTITLPRATVEQALEALEKSGCVAFKGLACRCNSTCASYTAAVALRSALEQQAEPVQEPAPMPPFPPVSQWNRGCAVCGIGADGKAYGYVCPRSDCPTRVTCGGVV